MSHQQIKDDLLVEFRNAWRIYDFEKENCINKETLNQAGEKKEQAAAEYHNFITYWKTRGIHLR
jgi:hypothetical protein